MAQTHHVNTLDRKKNPNKHFSCEFQNIQSDEEILTDKRGKNYKKRIKDE